MKEEGEILQKLGLCTRKKRKMDSIGLKDFKILTMLGHGGYGRVFLVQRETGKNIGKLYAMKTIWKPIIPEEVYEERTILEKVKGLPNLMQMYHAFTHESELHFILSYAGGSDLQTLVANPEKEITQIRIKNYMAGAVRGIGGLHQLHIIHRDIKLENILIDARGFTIITDFGISKCTNTRANSNCGTSAYQAPEMNTQPDYDKTVDWWALGIVLWELLTINRHEGGVIKSKSKKSHKFSKEATNLLQDIFLN